MPCIELLTVFRLHMYSILYSIYSILSSKLTFKSWILTSEKKLYKLSMTYERQFSFLCDDFKQTYPSQRKLFQKSLLLSKETNKDSQTYLTCPSNFFGSVFNCYKDQRSREHWRPPDWKHSKNFKCKWQKRPPRLVPTQVRAAQIWCGKYRPKALEKKVFWIKKCTKHKRGWVLFYTECFNENKMRI